MATRKAKTQTKPTKNPNGSVKKPAPKAKAPPKAKRPPGRPRIYTDKLADEVCRRLADGKSLRAICKMAGMPSKETVRTWLADDVPGFRSKYVRARADQADSHEADMDEIERKVLTGKLRPDAARVVLDSKRWRMEKLAPKVYGPRLNVAGVDDEPLTIVRKTYSGD